MDYVDESRLMSGWAPSLLEGVLGIAGPHWVQVWQKLDSLCSQFFLDKESMPKKGVRHLFRTIFHFVCLASEMLTNRWCHLVPVWIVWIVLCQHVAAPHFPVRVM